MNVLLLSQGYRNRPKEATGITLWLLAGELRRRGHEVAVISDNTDDDRTFKRTVRDGIDIYQFKASGRPGFFWAGVDQVLRYVISARKLRVRPDIIHGFSSAPALAARTVACRFLFPRAKTVHTLKSYSRVEGAKFRFASALRMVDQVTVPTAIMKKRLEERGVRGIRVIRSPIHLERFRPKDRDALKERYGFKGKKIVFYYGAMFENKGAHVLALAMHDVLKAEKDAIFIFAPRHGGWQVEKVREKAMPAGKNALFLEGDIAIEDYVAMADLVALPYIDISGTEGNPSCLLEAAASKTAVVTTDIPELREIMQKDKDILMAKPGDAASLAKEIKRGLADRRSRERLIENAYPKASSFDHRKITEEYEKIYKKLTDT